MKRPSWSTILTCLALFSFFLLVKFPFQNMRGYIFKKIFDTTGIFILAEEIYPSIFGWPGIGMKNVEVAIPLMGQALDLSSKKLVFKTGISGLLPPVPSVSMRMKGLKKGGDVYFWFAKGRSRFDTQIQASEVSLDQIHFSGQSDIFSGTLDADMEFNSEGQDLGKASGQLQLSIDKLRVAPQNLQGLLLPAVSLGNLKAKTVLKNGVAELSNFQFGNKDTDIQGTLAGEIRLGRDLTTGFHKLVFGMAIDEISKLGGTSSGGTFLNLILRFQVSDHFRKDPRATNILSFLDGYYKTSKPNEYGMKWLGTLDDIMTRTPLPQKLTE